MKKLLLFMPFLAITLMDAQVSLVKDINPSGNSSPSEFTVFNNQIYFQAGNDIELWTSDGTNSGTQQIIDIRGGGSSSPRGLIVFNNLLHFLANTSSTGASLFQSDGTLAGTTPFYTTSSSLFPEFTIMNNELFFIGAGQELFKTDGISISQLSTNINGTKHLFNYDNSKLLFQTTTQGASNWELWESDGSVSGTQLLAEIFPSTLVGSVPENFTFFNGKVYFTAITNAEGRELWVTDGTSGGTQLVIDLNTNFGVSSDPTELTVFNNALYFAASHPTLGREIFKMNVAETVTSLKNIASGTASSNPSNLFVSNGRLYFSADDNINGIELWSSTGFSSTTNMLKNINTSASSPDSNPSDFMEYFGELYFAADDGVNGRELWKTDGTGTGTILFNDINPSGDSNPTDLIVANNILFFSANDGSTGIELWKYQDPSLSVNESSHEDFSLYPNPTQGGFVIDSIDEILEVKVFDIHGKLIKVFTEDQSIYYIDNCASGIYFVDVETVKGRVTQKLIKN